MFVSSMPFFRHATIRAGSIPILTSIIVLQIFVLLFLLATFYNWVTKSSKTEQGIWKWYCQCLLYNQELWPPLWRIVWCQVGENYACSSTTSIHGHDMETPAGRWWDASSLYNMLRILFELLPRNLIFVYNPARYDNFQNKWFLKFIPFG
jgi:hypothetical protein